MAALQAVKRFRLRELASSLSATTTTSSNTRPKAPNPFIPHKNSDTGRWAPPKYSLRRQADLIKNARASNTLNLLPPGPKLSLQELSKVPTTPSPSAGTLGKRTLWMRQVEWEGEVKEKQVPGAEVGNRLYAGKRRMFKGHKWERTKAKREEVQKNMMQGMQKRIERFKQTYRRKAPSPLSVPRNTSYTKLPF